ncbi:MAG: hypothetical protein P4L79_17730 [Legionella sp.]|uniref:hypothetical protein n=1 Tax=Legionella sp. TaxID=459 RepID=UPI002844B635|nr:hypothetical protein [Legionella sp.]
MPLPHIIFTESHYDPLVFELIKKIAPKLKALGYNCFFNEAPEETTAADFILNQKNYAEFTIKPQFENLKHFADLGAIPRELFYESMKHLQYFAMYTAQINKVTFLENLPDLNIQYRAIDLKETKVDSQDYFITEEGIRKRDSKMSSAYLDSSSPVFGVIGYKHALGIQKEILSKLSLENALEKFYFVHIFSERPLDDYEEKLRIGEMNYPLGMATFDAKILNEETIIELILSKISANQYLRDTNDFVEPIILQKVVSLSNHFFASPNSAPSLQEATANFEFTL